MVVLVAFADYAYAIYLKLRSYFLKAPVQGMPTDNGAAVAIVIPGVYEDWSYFEDVAKTLWQAGYVVLNADRLVDMSGTLEQQAEQLARYVANQGLTKVTLLGHSSGGIVALFCAQIIPQEIDKVVTVATPFSGVLNGHLLRTSSVRQLLPGSVTIRSIQKIEKGVLAKVVSLYPSWDNQVWSRQGSVLDGARNYVIDAKGHHLVLRSGALQSRLRNVLS